LRSDAGLFGPAPAKRAGVIAGALFEKPSPPKEDIMKVMIRRSAETGLSIYVPKKDLEEPIVESEFETLWGGWIKIANGWVLELPEMAADTRLPITVNAKKRGEED
jgi:nitrogen fixation protein NifT